MRITDNPFIKNNKTTSPKLPAKRPDVKDVILKDDDNESILDLTESSKELIHESMDVGVDIHDELYKKIADEDRLITAPIATPRTNNTTMDTAKIQRVKKWHVDTSYIDNKRFACDSSKRYITCTHRDKGGMVVEKEQHKNNPARSILSTSTASTKKKWNTPDLSYLENSNRNLQSKAFNKKSYSNHDTLFNFQKAQGTSENVRKLGKIVKQQKNEGNKYERARIDSFEKSGARYQAEESLREESREAIMAMLNS